MKKYIFQKKRKNEKMEKWKKHGREPLTPSAIAGVTVIIGTLMSIRNYQRLSMIRGLGEIDKDSSTVQARERMARKLVKCVQEIVAALGRREVEVRQCTKAERNLLHRSVRHGSQYNHESARKKLESHLNSAMSFKLRRTSGKSDKRAPKIRDDPQQRPHEEKAHSKRLGTEIVKIT